MLVYIFKILIILKMIINNNDFICYIIRPYKILKIIIIFEERVVWP